ncbi:MAG: polysaccharide deacetylase family protein [Bacteroidota bacterium]|nr:polysaccharide deacetylase family protein [Bacteroidota bacterium]
MAGYREKFIHRTSWLTSLFPMPSLLNISGLKLLIPLYHAVSDEKLIHLNFLYDVKSIQAFTDELDFILNFYVPVDFVTFFDMVQKREVPTKPIVLLTFDDGFREVYDVIAPILLRKGIPAICFLNNDFIDNKNLFFRCKASILINEIESNIEFIQDKSIRAWFKDRIYKDVEMYKNGLLSISYSKRHLLDELAVLIKVNFDDYLQQHTPYMTKDQVSSLIKKGFHFGAHSADHPRYSELPLSEQLSRTKASIEGICSTFNLAYRSFAFPFSDYGVSQKYFEEINGDNKQVDISFGSAGLVQDSINNHFQRIPMEISRLNAAEIIKSEYLYFMMKSFVGKGMLIRN